MKTLVITFLFLISGTASADVDYCRYRYYERECRLQRGEYWYPYQNWGYQYNPGYYNPGYNYQPQREPQSSGQKMQMERRPDGSVRIQMSN